MLLLIVGNSSSGHERQPTFWLAPPWGHGNDRPLDGPLASLTRNNPSRETRHTQLLRHRLQHMPQFSAGLRATKGPRNGFTFQHDPRALRVEVRPSTIKSWGRRLDHDTVAPHQPHERRLLVRLATSDASTLRLDRTLPGRDHTSVSGWISMRQPVSLAAKRAFWPSRPIASDSW